MTALLAAVLVALFGVLGSAKLAAVPAMRTAAHHLRFSVSRYRVIGALEVAGALGIVVGFFLAPIGVAAGIGLALLMAGAVAAHALHRDPVSRIAVPLGVAAVVVLYLVTVL